MCRRARPWQRPAQVKMESSGTMSEEVVSRGAPPPPGRRRRPPGYYRPTAAAGRGHTQGRAAVPVVAVRCEGRSSKTPTSKPSCVCCPSARWSAVRLTRAVGGRPFLAVQPRRQSAVECSMGWRPPGTAAARRGPPYRRPHAASCPGRSPAKAMAKRAGGGGGTGEASGDGRRAVSSSTSSSSKSGSGSRH